MTPPVPLALWFLNPAMLWFAALGAAPILIYLFNRQRFRPMRWAAMDFVIRAVRTNRRRLQVENLLLLAIRVLAVLLLVTAVARPIARPIGPLASLADRRSHVAVVLDTSYSMGLKVGAKSSFERAQKAAHDLAQELLNRGDRFSLLLMAAEPRFVYEDPVFVDDATKARVLRDIQEVELTAQPTDAARALAALAQHVPRFESGAAAAAVAAGEGGATIPKQVYIFTDLQKGAFANDRGLKDPNVRRTAKELERLKAEITIVDCGSDDATNAAVTRLETADEVAGVDIPVRVTAAVKNFGPGALPDVTLEFVVDDNVQASPTISLEPGEEREVERLVIFRDPGVHRVGATLKTDALAVDNVRALAIEAREAVDVVLVDGERKSEFGEGETDFLAAALAPGEEGRAAREYLLRPQVIGDGSLPDIALPKSPVVVLANVVALPPDVEEALEQYVRAGGGVLIFLGPQVDASAWNERVWKGGKGLLPVRLDKIATTPDEERYHVLDAETFAHPVLKPFADKEMRQLFGLARFEGYWKVDWPETAIDDPTLQALAWFAPRRATATGEAAETAADAGAASRDPALVERRLGRGRVLLFTSTADGEWNNFFAQFAYLILWQKAAVYLADAGSMRRNLGVGEPYEAVVGSSEYAPQILLTTPGQDQIEKTLEKVPDEPDRFRFVHAETQRPGVYEVRFRGAEGTGTGTGMGTSTTERVDFFAVNVDPEEGDLARIEERELRELIPELKFKLEKERPERGARAADRKAEANEYWRYVLYAGLGLLALESLVALAFGRRAKL